MRLILRNSIIHSLMKALSLLVTCLAVFPSFSGGIRGTVKDEKGEPLAYTTIFVKQTGTGTATNTQGEYEIALAPGTYEVVFQFVGFETQVKQIAVQDDFIAIHVVMKTQVTVLQNVTVKAGSEDPAYTIMRKAIAKANYHRNQLDNYSARVYIKGAGKLKDYPWLAKKALEKEGVEKNRIYIAESVSDIKYTRPNKFEEKVISIRSDGKDNNASPNPYIFGSFYEPEIAETISPLSPKSFSYYRFEYLGTFKDREYEISRIKVMPRSKGDNVVDGIIYIVENWWSIHSIDLHTTKLGIKFHIRAVYAPIEDKAWLPVSHRFKIEGKIFGFEFEANYLATVSDYKITLNPELYVDTEQMEVIDEKLEKQQAKEIQEKFNDKKGKKNAQELQERLASGKEITQKELKTIIKEYEKDEKKQLDEPEVIFNQTFKIDSGAYKNDSAYWVSIRPIPLTREEIIGYQKTDSMAAIERKKQAGDTVKASKHKGFQPWDLVLGDNYKISKHSNFQIKFPMPGFNTVEGWNVVYKVGFGTILQDTNRTRLNITPSFRYAFSREVASGNLKFSMRNRKYRIEAEGGRYVDQYNADNPIHHIVNTFTTLMLEHNLMKIYERRYVDLLYRRRINPYVLVQTSWSWSRRNELFNTTDYKLVDREKVGEYTPNRPVSLELPGTGFEDHEALTGSIAIEARPWMKYRIHNGSKYPIQNSSPLFQLTYNKGFNNLAGSDVDFDQLEVGFKHAFDMGIRADIDVSLRAGMFLNARQMYFMDYKHFIGNKTPFITTDPAGSFRLLDYYLYSTADKYFAGSIHYQFRKFLVTTVPMVRLAGIRENIFLNYLATPTSKNYTEVGYSIDGILRIFRLEAAAAFQDGKFLDNGFCFGISTSIAITFND